MVKNKDIVTKLTSGNVLDLTQSLVLNNSEILGSQLNDTEKNNFSKLLSNPSMLSSLISGDVEDITSELLSNSSAIFDGAVGDKEISKYSKILTENKSLLAAISSNDKKGFLENILSKKSDWLGSGLQSNEISMISELLASNGQSIGNALNGNAPGLLSNVMASFDSNLKSDQLNPLSTLLLNDPEGLSALLKGDKNTLKSKLGDSEIPNLDSTLDTVLKNKGKLNHLLGLSPDKNFDILSKSPEELQVLSYNITNDSGVLSGVVAGDAATIANNFEKHNYDLDPELVQQLSNSLVKEKSNISQVVVNSTINQMLLNDEIDIQFFDFGPEALLEKYENVSLREKSFSQTAASILDPTTDPRDYTKLTINIFGKESDEILWQYINENTKTRLYDLNRTVAKVIDRVNKNFPYFIR